MIDREARDGQKRCRAARAGVGPSEPLKKLLGPGAGHDGGRIVFEGTPADLVKAKSTLTGEHLAASLR
jgi:hypothetical protein